MLTVFSRDASENKREGVKLARNYNVKSNVELAGVDYHF